MKLLLVQTGGTIGSRAQSAGVDVTPEMAGKLVDMFQRDYGETVEFTTIRPLYVLSETLTPADWLTIVQGVLGAAPGNYDGVIVTHGTDTLSYTAAVLSLALGHLPVPVVLTGASHPLEDRRTNGFRNFCNAVWFLQDKTSPRRGVYVIYENGGEHPRTLVHLGMRIMEAEAFNEAFTSVGDIIFGEMVGGRFIRFDHPTNPTRHELEDTTGDLMFKPESLAFSNGILLLTPYPGLDYSYYDFTTRKPVAVAHKLYHSGTACIRPEGGRYCLRDFTRKCLDAGIDVYSCPVRERQMGERYVTAQTLLDVGVQPLENMSWEAALAKLTIGYGTFADAQARRTFIKTVHRHEFVDFQRRMYGKSQRQL